MVQNFALGVSERLGPARTRSLRLTAASFMSLVMRIARHRRPEFPLVTFWLALTRSGAWPRRSITVNAPVLARRYQCRC
jgi:hypothetical protein